MGLPEVWPVETDHLFWLEEGHVGVVEGCSGFELILPGVGFSG